MSVPRFADVIKAAKDLLSKPYPETNKVELKTSAASGATFTAEAVLDNIVVKGDRKPTPALLVKGEGKVASGLRVDKVSVDTNKDVAADFSLTEAFGSKRTKLTFKALDATRSAFAGDKASAVLGVEHKLDNATVTVDIDALKVAVETTAVFNVEGFLLGSSVKVVRGASKPELADYNALVGYKARDFTVSVQGEKKFATLVAAFHQVVNSQLTVATVAKVPRVASGDKPASLDLAVGLQYKSTPDVTVSAKLAQTGLLSLAYAQQLSPMAKLTAGVAIDAKNPAADSHKLALSLALVA